MRKIILSETISVVHEEPATIYYLSHFAVRIAGTCQASQKIWSPDKCLEMKAITMFISGG